MTSKQTLSALVFLLALSTIHAQSSRTGRYVVDGFVLPADENAAVKPGPAERVNIRAARDFGKRFKAASPAWRQLNDTTIARFTADSATVHVGYNKNGKWLYTVKSFTEWLIPEKIRHEVKSQYYDYRIHMAHELVFPGNLDKVYLFYMKDMSGNSKVLRWSEDGLQVVKSHKTKLKQ